MYSAKTNTEILLNFSQLYVSVLLTDEDHCSIISNMNLMAYGKMHKFGARAIDIS